MRTFHLSLSAIAALAALLLAAIVSVGPVFADGFNRIVEIKNNASSPIVGIYAGSHNYMGANLLMSGQSVQVNFDDGSGNCIYSIRAEFNNGSSKNYRVDVCTLSRYTFF